MSTRPTRGPGAGQRPARELEVLATGAQTTVQDRGRPGLAALGVGRSGAADARSLDLANRLLGNPPEAAALEVTVGGLAVRARGGGGYVALTGADCPMSIDGRPVPSAAVVWLPDGAELRLGVPTAGLRSYLAVRGGIDVPSVLGSRATDTLAGLGPAPLRDGAGTSVGFVKVLRDRTGQRRASRERRPRRWGCTGTPGSGAAPVPRRAAAGAGRTAPPAARRPALRRPERLHR